MMTKTDKARILEAIRAPYRLSSNATINPLGNGHINQTLLVRDTEQSLVAQRVNTNVFPDPRLLLNNARAVESHLARKENAPKVVRHLPGKDGNYLHGARGDIRVLEYIQDSRSIEVLESLDQAREIAFTFARFTRALCDLDSGSLVTVIPNFHNPSFRYSQYLEALQLASATRTSACAQEVEFVKKTSDLLPEWQSLIESLPVRICHNDCKINNVLISNDDPTVLTVIDLDTCMPGCLMTDFGDLVRSCCSPEEEDSTELEQVTARADVFAALVEGYLAGLNGVIRAEERASLVPGAMMVCFIQGVRFLTDFLAGDSYYAVDYPLHNLDRARNQFQLFRGLLEQKNNLSEMCGP